MKKVLLIIGLIIIIFGCTKKNIPYKYKGYSNDETERLLNEEYIKMIFKNY